MTEELTALAVLGAIVIFSTDIAVAVVAGKKDRPVIPWFLAALFFTPIVALLMLIALGDSDE